MSTATRATGAARPERATTRPGHPLVGTGTLIRHILRRDRIRVPVWIVAITGTVLSSAASFPDLFPSDVDVAARVVLVNGNPAGRLLTGPGYGLEDASADNLAPLIAHEMSSMTIILVVLMSMLLLVRYTRAEEESGRAELVRAGVLGRHAPLTAALVVVAGANIVVGGLVALGLYAMDLPLEGSVAFGVSMALLGLVFAAVAALCAQVTEYGRAAVGLAGLLFAAAFAVRAVGDVRDSDLRWLSPVGWTQGMRPFADEQWWPALYLVGLAILLAVAAYLLNAQRDLGAAIIRPRPGRTEASPWLGSPLGLAVRLQRASVLTWTVSLFAGGALIGAIVAEAESLAELDVVQQFMNLDNGGSGLEDQVMGMYLPFFVLTAGGLALQSVLRARVEETAGRAEPVLSAAVPRWSWAGSHLAVSLGGTTLALALVGLGAGLVRAIQTGDNAEILRLTGAALGYLPALAVLVGLAFALFGVLPRAVGLAWAVLGYSAFVMMFAPLFVDLPDWVGDLSPFTHLPRLPAEEFEAGPFLVQSAIALGLIVVGFLGFQRRDVHTT